MTTSTRTPTPRRVGVTDAHQKDIESMPYSVEDIQKWVAITEATLCPVCKEHNLTVDISMRLIQCDGCGLSFEYRYDRGVIPFHTIRRATL